MPLHFREFARRVRSPGLVLIPQGLSVGTAIDSIALIIEACIPERSRKSDLPRSQLDNLRILGIEAGRVPKSNIIAWEELA
jgi:hypothetical protein